MAYNPHDALVKRGFSEVENAAGELRVVLPASLVAAMDFATLKLEPGSFVDEELAQSHTDLLYSVELEGREAFVYLLFEHQSTVDALMVFRLLCYACRIWERWLADHPGATRLPAVIPVVLYHGVARWSAARRMHEMVSLPPELLDAVGRHVPEVEMVLDDLGELSFEQIRQRAMTAVARLVLVSLRLSGRGEPPEEAARVFAALSRELDEVGSGQEALLTILRYLGDVMGRERQDFIDAVVAADGGDVIREANVTYNEMLLEEGREEGRAEGRLEERRSLVMKQLVLKFGPATAEVERRVAKASADELERWAERVLTAARIEEVWE